MDIVSSVRGLFPDVGATIEKYQLAKPDREVRNLARRLANEETLYDQFIRKLSLFSSTAALKGQDDLLLHVESKFGVKTSNDLRSDLRRMEEFLRGLKADLANTSRGTEVLAKFRRTRPVSRVAPPRNLLQKRLDDVSRANKRLALYLLFSQIPLGLERNFRQVLDFKLLFHQTQDELPTVLLVTSEQEVCACQEVVCRNTGQNNHQSSNLLVEMSQNCHDYTDAGNSPQQEFKHISIQSFLYSGEGNPFLLGAASTHKQQDGESHYPYLAKRDKDKKSIRLSVKATNLPVITTSWGNLILRRDIGMDQRMELAFQLSSAILLLWTSHLIIDFSKWKDWVVSFDPEAGNELTKIYLSPKSQSEEDSIDKLGDLKATARLWSTLLEIRRDYGTLLQYEEEKDQNEDLLDFMMAKRLLASHRVAEEFGQHFEDVVNTCLNQQYRERKGAGVAELSFQDKSVLERAAVSVLLPLYQEAHKYSGCTCNGTSLSRAEQSVVKSPQADVDKSHVDNGNFVQTMPTSEKFRMPEDGVNNTAYQASTGLPMPHPSKSITHRQIDSAREGSSSNDSVLRGEQPVEVDPNIKIHDPNKSNNGSNRSHDGIAEPQFPISEPASTLVGSSQGIARTY